MAIEPLTPEEKKLANKKEKPVSYLDKLVNQAIADKTTFGREDDPAKQKYPELWRWLTRTECPGDRVKSPASITLRMGPEGVLLSISDRDLNATIDVAAAFLENIFEATENALTSPNPAIRTNSKRQPKVRKRKSSS